MRTHILGATIALISLITTAPPAFADTTAAFMPDKIFTNASGDILNIDPPSAHTFVNPNSCSSTDAYSIDPYVSSGQKERVSLALASVLNDKEMILTISGCSSVTNRPIVIRVDLLR